MWLEINAAHVSNNLIDIMADKIATIKKNTETLTLVEVGLEVKAEKTDYMLLSCH